MNNPQMANDQLKKDLKKILKIQGNVSKERPVKGLIKKENFCKFLELYKYANDRTMILKGDYQVDFVNYEEPFVQAIEALLKVTFNASQQSIIEWWLYEKWNSVDEILRLTNTDTGEEIPSETPEELWDLIQSLK